MIGLVLFVELVVLVGFVGAVRTIEIVEIEIKKVRFASIISGKKKTAHLLTMTNLVWLWERNPEVFVFNQT